jgi:hypothetical protein
MEFSALERVVEFEWDTGNIKHIAQHNGLPDEAEEIFSDRNNV